VVIKKAYGIFSALAVALGLVLILAWFFGSALNAEQELDQAHSLLQRYLLQRARGHVPESAQSMKMLHALPVWGPLAAMKSLSQAELNLLWTDGRNAEAVDGELKDFILHQRNVYNIIQYFLVAALCAVVLISFGLVLLNDQRKTMEQRLRRLHQSSLVALEEERKALSRDLHDTVAQELAAVKMFLTQATLEPSVEAPLKAALDSALSQVRQVAVGLRPPSLDRLGFVSSLRELGESTAQSSGMAVHLDLPTELEPLDEATAINLYRIVQEALQNAVRHSHGKTVRISLRVLDQKLLLEFCDDGVGLGVAASPSTQSERRLGLVGMHERATLIGATLQMESSREKGTRFSLELPR